MAGQTSDRVAGQLLELFDWARPGIDAAKSVATIKAFIPFSAEEKQAPIWLRAGLGQCRQRFPGLAIRVILRFADVVQNHGFSPSR